jgi:hypothetical protein
MAATEETARYIAASFVETLRACTQGRGMTPAQLRLFGCYRTLLLILLLCFLLLLLLTDFSFTNPTATLAVGIPCLSEEGTS